MKLREFAPTGLALIACLIIGMLVLSSSPPKDDGKQNSVNIRKVPLVIAVVFMVGWGTSCLLHLQLLTCSPGDEVTQKSPSAPAHTAVADRPTELGSRILGRTKAKLSVIAAEANPDYYVTTLRCPVNGWTFNVVWHCSVDDWPSPGETGIDGYAIESVQIKDILSNNTKDLLLIIVVFVVLIVAILGACAVGLI